MRQSISETISGVGLISRLGSREAVEDKLLELAASSEIEVQAVAARSIAAWRDQDYQTIVLKSQPNLDLDKELFSVLENWQTETRISKFISFLLKDKAKKNSEEPADYIRSTLAITVAYASLYDFPNQLSEELYKLFEELSEDKNRLVRDRFKTYTIPFFINRHLSTVRDFLITIVQDADLIPPVAESLALAYGFNAAEVLSLLEEWRSDCKTEYTEIATLGKLDKRESLLLTVALTYCKISYGDFSESDEKISVETAFSRLLEIFKYERHKKVRKIVATAIAELIKQDFQALSSHLKDLIGLSSQQENKALMNVLSEVYLVQRSVLKDGERTIEIDGQKYPVWLDTKKRKLTDIERDLMIWLKDDSSQERQKFSAQALMSFVADFEDKEITAIEKLKTEEANLRKESSDKKDMSLVNTPVTPERPQESMYLSRFIPWLATQKSVFYRTSISNLLPEAAKQRSVNSSKTDFLLNKLKKNSDPTLADMSGFLGRAIWLSKFFFPLSLGFLFLVYVVTASIGAAVKENSESFPTPPEPSSNPSSNSGSPPLVEPELDPELSEVENPFFSESFPKDVCGDPLPSDLSAYPVQLYPVYVDYDEETLNVVKTQACADAIKKKRENTSKTSIQVASFLSRQKAELFKDFLSNYFTGAEVGEPTQIDRNASESSSFSSPKIFDRGAVQFPAGAIETQIEGNLAASSIDRYTFSASAGQNTAILMNSSSQQVRLAVTAPNGAQLTNQQNSSTSWAGNLPKDGTYTIDVIGGQASSTYKIGLRIEP
ncbi:PPC domain-containing protein [Leptothoe sp. LEGE 181152]|nr:PPC domain-containing protein [Leptothoe sp. LEGE 181152]